ncbi:MAG TPA: MmcQ/YjbR family DNA-binding protein [Solirubrobacteraceae bacterium]
MALELPDAVELDHHGIPSLRVNGKIFATVPDERHIRVMLDEGGVLAAVAENPTICQKFWWGSRLACVVVDLNRAETELLRELLADAWRRKAPRQLLREHDCSP